MYGFWWVYKNSFPNQRDDVSSMALVSPIDSSGNQIKIYNAKEKKINIFIIINVSDKYVQ